jgi:DNA-directed RNA polymerase specialized sigma24 family protein
MVYQVVVEPQQASDGGASAPVVDDGRAAFESFARSARPRLIRALVPVRGIDGAADAAAEALAYAWEHWADLRTKANPAGYLYRVAQSRSRARRQPDLPAPIDIGLPDIEPRLIPALLVLPVTQRTAVWLVYGCGWSYAEAADALDTSTSAVGTHLTRGMASLRKQLGVTT